MKITITARKFKAHDTLKEFIEAEVSSLNKYSDEIMDADIILSFQNSANSVKTAEIILKVPGQILTATETTDDFPKSVTAAVEKLIRQVQKLKTKRNQH
ncbi:MAG: ribosome-associated translation inhibitor RaiA [Ignavibacteria bacterium]|jgi:putative sigma-54 modulation protein|nr:ribosome-associated translation inhibitor RaiA [Ignavibacteria bacterium]